MKMNYQSRKGTTLFGKSKVSSNFFTLATIICNSFVPAIGSNTSAIRKEDLIWTVIFPARSKYTRERKGVLSPKSEIYEISLLTYF